MLISEPKLVPDPYWQANELLLFTASLLLPIQFFYISRPHGRNLTLSTSRILPSNTWAVPVKT